MSLVEKIYKGIYLTPEQIAKAEKIRIEFSRKAGIAFSFSATIAKLIEDKKK